MTGAEIDEIFAFHPADTDEKKAAHELVRSQCRELAHWMNNTLPNSREKSMAITHLQEAMMCANSALAVHGGHTKAVQ